MPRRSYKRGGITVSVPQDAFETAVRWLYDDGSRVVTEATAAVVTAARAAAPERFGDLRRGIVASGFETDPGGKRILQVAMDPAMNETFAKYSNGKRYYYPASQEYGFRTRPAGARAHKSKYSTRRFHGHVPGRYFMKTTAVAETGPFQAAVEKSLEEALEKEADS